MKGAANTKTVLLVTDAERVAKLHELLGSRFTNHGQLFIPTLRHYESLDTNEGLLALAKDFCRWLGFKPATLTVAYREQAEQSQVVDNAIYLNQEFREHPLATGGILALATIRFILAHKQYAPDTRFVEVASVETGFGIWILNALPAVRSRREAIYHMLDGAWLQLEGIQLATMTTAEYIRLFTIFTSQNRLFPEDYSRGISRRNRYVIPPSPSDRARLFLPEPTATTRHIKKANALWLRLGLIALIISTVAVCSTLLWAHRAKPLPPGQTSAEQSLQVIKQSLNNCIHTATEQQNSYDPNDIFMSRQIDATKSRCESLRNQYNDQLDTYQKTYLR